MAAASVSNQEWELRVLLAGAYRIIDHMGWSELIWTHTTVRIPGPEHHFLINPYGFRFDEVRASNLVKIDMGGNVIGDQTQEINPAGFVIHSAIHMARPDAVCVMHTHTVAGMAVSMQAHGLLSASQHACFFHGNLGYHDIEHMEAGVDGRAVLARDLGDRWA